MSSAHRVVLMITTAFVIGSVPAGGQEPDPVRLSLDLGFVDVSGNTNVTTFNLGEKFSYTTGRWTFAQLAAVIYGSSDGSATAEQYDAGLRADYAVVNRLSVFAGVSYYRNVFAGLAERWNEGAGLAWKALSGGRDSLRLEGALVINQERNLADQRRSFGAGRTAVHYKHLFGESAFVTQFLEWVASVEDADDQRVNSETALTAPISRQIALKAAYVIRFDNQPEPGKLDTDRSLTTGLQIVF